MNFLYEYMKRYKVTYILICLIFLLGFIIGSIFLINTPKQNKSEIRSYIVESVNNSNIDGIDKLTVFKKSIIEYVKFVLILYLLGCTIIAGFMVYIAIIYKGFVLGYTSAAIFISYNIGESIRYLFLTLILHNIVFLPIVFLLAMSGIRLYKEIMKKNYNLKTVLLRHTVILLICLVFCIIASGIEGYFSTIIFEIL